MRQPDMSQSHAYYQDQPQIVTAYLSDAEGRPAVPPTAYLPAETQPSSQQHSGANHDGIVDFPSSERASVHTSTSRPYPSDSWDSAYPQSNRHSLQPSVKRLPHTDLEPTAAPVTSVPSAYLEGNPILSSYGSGAARKEDRVRGSWTDHSSYMSGEDRNPGVARVPKRESPDVDFYSDNSEDAVLMLLCDLLVPQLHIHERLIGLRPQSVNNEGEQSSDNDYGEDYSIGGLIMVLLLSSLTSFGLLLLAWIAAFFWIFAMILGNPDGTERKDDGRAAVLGVSRWWRLWLGKARSSG
ncbi:uncharacterized protein DSM5745_02224 [Aspergillus mulundensis]|uniref:Uncharacterized protein n=1 Tax=Aspergillus mulundensis TaxID=1810919 RepID=A0A3D8SW11_9EURO|nr:Uncharacterized protein DSM5745_02224 [Aspergillus mulundensis]RDW90449.1 Uncharacterized protein DSM5745_02224 [Aspergillus mulundensis]